MLSSESTEIEVLPLLISHAELMLSDDVRSEHSLFRYISANSSRRNKYFPRRYCQYLFPSFSSSMNLPY